MKKTITRLITILAVIMLFGCFSAFAEETEKITLTAPKNVTAAQNTSAIKLTWEEVENATGYRIYYKSGGKWKVGLKKTENLTHTFSNLKAGTKFTLAVRAYNITGDVITWADTYTTINTATKPEKVSLKTSQTTSSLTLNWNKVKCDGYRIYYKYPDSTNWKTATKTTTKNSQSYTKLPSGRVYQFAVRAYVNAGSKTIWGGYDVYNTATKPIATKTVNATQTYDSITLKWTKVPNATYYKVGQKINGKWVRVAKTTDLTATIKDLKAGTNYTFGIQAFIETKDVTANGSIKEINTATKPVSTKKITTTSTENSITLNWEKVEGASAYRIYSRTSAKEDWKIAINSVKDTKATITNLTPNTTYQLAVRSYTIVGSSVIWGAYNIVNETTKTEVTPDYVEITDGGLKLYPITSNEAKEIYNKWGDSSYIYYETKNSKNIILLYTKDSTGWSGSDIDGATYDASGNICICDFCGKIEGMNTNHCDGSCHITFG